MRVRKESVTPPAPPRASAPSRRARTRVAAVSPAAPVDRGEFLLAVPAASAGSATSATSATSAASAEPTGDLAAGARRRLRRARWLRAGRLLAAFGVLAGTIFGVTVATRPASAAPWDCPFGSGNITNAGPEHGGSGMTAWIPVIAKEDVEPGADPDKQKRGRQANPSDHTLLEVAGPRGLLWSYTPKALNTDVRDGKQKFATSDPESNFETQCSVMDASATGIAQMLFSFGGFFGGLTIGMKQLASNEAPFETFYDAQQSLLTNLNDKIGVPAIALAVAVAGLWVLTRIHRRADSRETYAGVISSALIVVAITAILTGNNYVKLTGAVDKYTSEFNSAVMDLAIINRNTDASSACYLPTVATPNQANPQADAQGARPPQDSPRALTYNLGKRVSSCMLYEVLLFQPWVNGQFGTERQLKVDDLKVGSQNYCPNSQAPAYQRPKGVTSIEYRCDNRPVAPGQDRPKINLAVQQVVAQSLSRDQTIDEADGKRVDTGQNYFLWKGVQYKIAQVYPQNYEFWEGTQPTGRMATAIAALFVNLIAFVFVGLLALLTIFWHAVFLMAWIFLPVIGAIAAFPPARRIVRMMAGVMVQAVFLRCVFGLVLALLLAVLNILQVAQGGMVIKIFLMLVATAAIWKILSALRTGALAPQVVQEAAQAGVVPADTGASARTRAAVGGAYLMQRGVRSGARSGAMAGAEAAEGLGYERGSRQWRTEVRRGRMQGAVAGGRMTTQAGRAQTFAGDQGRMTVTRTQAPALRRRRDEAAEQRRIEDWNQAEGRHEEVIEALKNPGGGKPSPGGGDA
ncbi:hypothetical protein SAMN05421678_10861 [Actinopolymorpha cephalotaxi]|uniref:TrbL/VirB6 plasmid conjugal transfer protein n=1 Tax=Actinopolymorpha cephalotaxi TaxID=504797 RepID=A0A1I2U806_9ACTN|nr:hypothetical protein [Actinopolymorpha cephalotaxi]NYH86480.1 hypothetical protein [Actinopolymorpha cephalotaxi]SFG73274.1 hypothetical protein SAMN05421678_10861 [Actinopolymorpha cephalotaxi]